MKKFLFAAVSAVAFSIMTFNIMNYKSVPNFSVGEKDGYREIFNSETNMMLARKIAAVTTANRVAVVGGSDGVLVGIDLKAGTTGRSKLRETAENLIREHYKDATICIEIQTEKAEKILSLAAYLETGIPQSAVASRMRYLLKTD